MGMRNRGTSSWEPRFLVGPDNKISKRDPMEIRLLAHLNAQSGPGDPMLVSAFVHEVRHVVEQDNELKFRLYHTLSPEPRDGNSWDYTNLHWASINGLMDVSRPFMFFDRDKRGKQYFYEATVNPMLRIQHMIATAIHERRCDPDRVVLRVPNHVAFNNLDEARRAVNRSDDPRYVIDPNGLEEPKDWKDRVWFERLAGV